MIHAADTGGSVTLVSKGTIGLAGAVSAIDSTAGTISADAQDGTLKNSGTLTAGALASLTAHTDLNNSGSVTVSNGPAVLVATTGTLGQSGTVTATSGGTLTAQSTLSNSGLVSVSDANGVLALTSTASDVDTSGTIQTTGTAGAIRLTAHGSVNQTAGLIAAGSPDDTSTAGAPTVTLMAQTGTIAQSAGSILTNNSAGTISLSALASGITMGGIVSAGGTSGMVNLTAYSSILQNSGTILSGGSGTISAASGSATPNLLLVAQHGSIEQNAGALIQATGSAGVIGLQAAGNIGFAGSILARGGLPGPVIAASETHAGVWLNSATGSIIEDASSGLLETGLLVGNAGGSVSLTGSSGDVPNLGHFTAGGSFNLVDSQGLTVLAPVTAGSGSVTINVTGGGPGTLTNLSQIQGQTGVTLLSQGFVTNLGTIMSVSNDVSLIAGSFTLSNSGVVDAANNAVLSAGADIDNAAGATIAAGHFATLSAAGSINDSGRITAAGAGSAGSPSVQLVASGGAIDETGTGTISATDANGLIALNASSNIGIAGYIAATGANGRIALVSTSGSISELAATGLLRANSLTGSAAQGVTLNGTSASGNLIANLDSFSAGVDFALIDGQDLAVIGPVIANTGSVVIAATHFGGNPPSSLINQSTIQGQTGVTLTADANVTNQGTINAVSNDIHVTAGDGTLSSTGHINAGRLAELTALHGANMTLGGILSAPTIQAKAGDNLITLNSGISIRTNGTVRQYGTFQTLPPDAFTTEGAYFTAGSFQQLGAATVSTLSGTGNVMSVVVSKGPITFSASGLDAPDTWLILNGSNGSISGAINVKALDVVYTGNSGGSELTGLINNYNGHAAAGQANIEPTRNSKYHVNSCPIHSVNCVLLPTEGIPAANPLNEFFLGSFFNPQDEGDLLLPIVSDQDY